MNILLISTILFLMSLALGIGYFATRLYEKSIFLGFVTTLLGLIIPFSLLILFIYLYGLYHHGHPLQFKW
ncbi:hypothetical protein [Fictibacillus phosphorivorans]|uniref:hypothetical protein n=1 Tax=Fictibacillus phosphorivorans TaxID=1221500 RepID=UPI00203C8A24|nr:hypothetical protein [Fictibacillus phosphorivorans]MCM3720246.1 hypothetical protein [Fictibacillus phosphorivorans]MCM3777958.1 hypothetical protein [Fictibacillus phosphorivorans]